MFRRNFIKGLLSSPLALLGGKDEEFVMSLSDARKTIARDRVSYERKDGELVAIELPKGKWLPKQIVFTRVKGE
jgi:hypothetical protein